MRDLSKFEFLNLLGIWLFQRVSNLKVFPSFRTRANRGKHNIEKDIPFYQFPAKADPSVRLSPFCFPSTQSRDSDRNNNYPSPASISVRFLLRTRYVFTPPDLSPTETTDPRICRRLSFNLPILFEFSFSHHLSSSKEGKEERALEMEVDYCTSVDRIRPNKYI